MYFLVTVQFAPSILQLEEYLNFTLGKVNKICQLLMKAATTDHKVVKINKYSSGFLLSPIFDISDQKRQSCPFVLHLFRNLHQDDTGRKAKTQTLSRINS